MHVSLSVLALAVVGLVNGWVLDKRSARPGSPSPSQYGDHLEGGVVASAPPPSRVDTSSSRVPLWKREQRRAQQYPQHRHEEVRDIVRSSVGFPDNNKGYGPEQCKQLCLEETSFACLAAFIQHPDNCFLTGFFIRPDPQSDHFYRTCEHGSNCFIKEENHSSGTHQIDNVSIPWYFPNIKYQYCMALCEHMTSCVGFDIVDKPPRCVFQDLQRYTDYSFDMYLRQC